MAFPKLMIPISASELRLKPAQHKREMLEQAVFPIYQQVLQTAKMESSLFVDIHQTVRHNIQYFSKHGTRLPTPEEEQTYIDNIVCILKEYFIDCNIEYRSDWVEISPGKKHEKKGIYIKWL